MAIGANYSAKSKQGMLRKFMLASGLSPLQIVGKDYDAMNNMLLRFSKQV